MKGAVSGVDAMKPIALPRQHEPMPIDHAASIMFSAKRPQSNTPLPSSGEAMNTTVGALRNILRNDSSPSVSG